MKRTLLHFMTISTAHLLGSAAVAQTTAPTTAALAGKSTSAAVGGTSTTVAASSASGSGSGSPQEIFLEV